MNFLGLSQAPQASWLNGTNTATAREYWLRPTQTPVNGPRIASAVAGMTAGEFRSVWVNSADNIFRVRSAEDGDGFDILDWNPRGAWDAATSQIYIGGFRERRKIIAYSDVTGDWREVQCPMPMARITGTGHWYGMTVADDSGGVWVGATGERQLYRLNPVDDSSTTTPTLHEVTNGSNGAMLSFGPNLFTAGGIVKKAGDARRWMRYDPVSQTWDRPSQGSGNGNHSLIEYHPNHDRWLMVGGTLTSRIATLVTEDGVYTPVTDVPDDVKMSEGSWIHPHPAGCWLVRTVNDTTSATRLYAAWPNAGLTDVTWVDLGVAPDSALSHPTLVPGYASDLVLIVATTGIYAYKLPALSPPGAVQSDFTAAYSILASAANDLAASYEVVEGVERELEAAYGVIASASSDLTAAYEVLATGVAASDLTATYAVLAAVQRDVSAAYEVLVSAESDLLAAYSVAQSVSADLIAAYAISAPIQRDLTAVYSVASSTPGSCDPADIWGFVLPNGLTAQQTLLQMAQQIDELHRIHGLQIAFPLTTTDSARAAGDISQVVSDDGSTVTVQRQ